MNWSLTKRNGVISLIAYLFIGTVVFAQNVGSLQGTVADPSGSSVIGATIQLTDLDNNATRTATTDSSGTFSFKQLNPGVYKVEVSKDGFKTHVEERVNILVATPTELDVHLELGS